MSVNQIEEIENKIKDEIDQEEIFCSEAYLESIISEISDNKKNKKKKRKRRGKEKK